MARIRNIKPDFFIDEDLTCIPIPARMFFAGLWCHADRDGRLEYRPKKLKVQIFPYDDINVEELCKLLSDPKISHRPDKKFIEIYEVDGEQYIQILNLGKHQKFHKDEKPRNFPASRMPAGCQQGAGCNTLKNEESRPAGCQQGASRPDSGFLRTETENGNGSTAFPPGFEPDRINSDTPLPPVVQAEWDKIQEIYPKPRGIIKGRDRAVRLLLKSSERARILRNATHYAASHPEFVMNLDKFVETGYRDYDEPEQPSGGPAPPFKPDLALANDIAQMHEQFKHTKKLSPEERPRPACLKQTTT